jgi:hypothetical protein
MHKKNSPKTSLSLESLNQDFVVWVFITIFHRYLL